MHDRTGSLPNDPSLDGGFVALVARQVDQRPFTCAVREPFTGDIVTYQELWQRSGELAAELVRSGVRAGEVVAVGEDRSIAAVIDFLAIARAGAVYLPLDSGAPAERQAEVLTDAGVDVLMTSSESAKWSVLPTRLRRIRPPDDDSATPFTDVPVRAEDPLYLNYTSGSTGRPKGVLVPHRAVVRLVTAPKFCTIEPGDRVAHSSNLAFDAATFELWNTLTSGGTVVVFPTVTDLPLDDWIALLGTEGITTMFLTTSLFHMVARERPTAFKHLRTVVVGGEQMDLAATQRVLAHGGPQRLVNGYGPTETTTFAAYYDCASESLAGLDRVPVGFPLQDTRLHVLDEQLCPVPLGQQGELCIGGSGVALGYLNQPELTDERFVAEPGVPGAVMYRTGDLARELPGGAVELTGRRDRQVKLRGFRIELGEIEHAATTSGLVDSAFVEKVGEGSAAMLVGFVLPTSSEDVVLLPRALTDRLTRALPSYMVPARWIVVSELPYGPTGKIDRGALLDLLGKPGDTREAVPSDGSLSVNERLASIWRDVLGVDTANPTDNFFDVGGNSILAIQLASRVRERLAVNLEPTDVLLASSFAELAGRVAVEASAVS